MRTVPENLITACKDKSIPIKKKVLLYRRYWDDETSAYLRETLPIDITPYIVTIGKVKLKLDVEECNKWEISNFNLTLNNANSLFTEGKSGGLLPSHIFWGSKIVYEIYPEDYPDDKSVMFTGYLLSTPTLRDDGNTIDLIVSSDLEALENISAEGVCLFKTNEECTAVPDSDDKEFTTSENGVGFVDEVKYGADFASSVVLEKDEFKVSDTNTYDKPAKITLSIVPTVNYKLFATYRYWLTDYPIDALVNLLLDLTEIAEENREISRPLYPPSSVKYYQTNVYNNAIMWQYKKYVTNEIEVAEPTVLDGTVIVNGWNAETLQRSKVIKNETQLPLSGLFFADLQLENEEGTPFCTYELCGEISGENSIGFGLRRYGFESYWGVGLRVNGSPEPSLYTTNNRICGIAIDLNNHLWVYELSSGVVVRSDLGTLPSLSFSQIKAQMINHNGWALNYDLTAARYYKSEIPSSITNTGIANFISTYLQNDAVTFGTMPCIRFDFHITEEYFTSWGSFSCDTRQSGASADIKFYWADSDDGITYSTLNEIEPLEEIGSLKRYLRFYIRTESAYNNFFFVDNFKIWSLQEGAYVALANFTEKSVFDAIKDLAELVAYEIGLNQDGVFFFRPREGVASGKIFTDAEITGNLEKDLIDIDMLFNSIKVDAGSFTTSKDDVSEGKSAPTSINKYGTRTKKISFNDFIPKDNIDITEAICLLNYDAFSKPLSKIEFDAIIDVSIELGDIIEVVSENTNLTSKSATDEVKEIDLPFYKIEARVVGLEYDFDKKKMSIEARS